MTFPVLQDCTLITEGGCTLGSSTGTRSVDDGTTSATTESSEPTFKPADTTFSRIKRTTGICPPEVFGNVPHPDRCDAFYLCVAGTAILQTCMEGHEFNVEVKNCALITEGGCTLGSSIGTTPADEGTTGPITSPDSTTATTESSGSTFEPADPTSAPIQTTTESGDAANPVPNCPPGVSGNIPHPERCDAFYLCIGGTDLLMVCKDGYEFNPETRDCILIAEGGCTLGSSTGTTPADDDTTPPNTPPDFTPATTESSDLTFEPADTTSAPIQTTTKNGNEDTPAPVCPPGVFGNIPHPERCDAFYLCLAGTAILQTCVEGHEFDHEVQNCALIAEGGCTLGSSTGTTPADDETTAPNTPPDYSPATTESSDTTFEPADTTSTLIQTTTGREDETTPVIICPPGEFGNVPHPDKCDAYYMCLGGNTILLYCTEGHEFNPEIQNCALIAEGGCTLGSSTGTTPADDDTTAPNTPPDYSLATTESSDTTFEPAVTTSTSIQTTTGSGDETTPASVCPPGVFGNVPHPDKCDAYYMCLGGNTILLYCTEGHEFNPEIQNCALIAEGGCTLGSSTGTTPADDDTTAPNTPPDYSPATTESSDTTFEPADTTSTSIQTTTGSGDETTPASVCPPGVFGNVPHPVKCDAYYMCLGGNTILLYCTEGHEFNPEIQNCALITEGGCTLGSSTGTTPADDDTTASNTPPPDATPATTESSESTFKPADTTSTSIQTTTGREDETTPAIICPPGVFGNVPHPVKCDAYYMCLGGNTILLYCTEGHEFNPEIQICALIAEGGCTLGSSTGTTPADDDTTASNTPPPDATPATTESSEPTSNPSDTTSALIQTTTGREDETTPASVCPPGVFGNVPHPDRCDAFYMCVAGTALLQTCSVGHEFNPDVGNCVLSNSGCTAK